MCGEWRCDGRRGSILASLDAFKKLWVSKREYEEDNFTRIKTKKEGKKRRKTQTDELLSFDFGGFDRAEKKSLATTHKKSMRQRVEEVRFMRTLWMH